MATTSTEHPGRIARPASIARRDHRHARARAGVSLVRTRAPGVTVLPSAEGPSLRSDPRWTTRRAHRTERLLQRLVARRRPSTAR